MATNPDSPPGAPLNPYSPPAVAIDAAGYPPVASTRTFRSTMPLAKAITLILGIEVLAVATGQRPRTAGQVLAVGPAHDARAAWPVAFHHGCACALLPAA